MTDVPEDLRGAYSDYGTIGQGMLMTRVISNGNSILFRHTIMAALTGREWFDFECVAWGRKFVWHVSVTEAYTELRRLEDDGVLVRRGDCLSHQP